MEHLKVAQGTPTPDMLSPATKAAIRKLLGYGVEIGKGGLWGMGLTGAALVAANLVDRASDWFVPEPESVETLFPRTINVSDATALAAKKEEDPLNKIGSEKQTGFLQDFWPEKPKGLSPVLLGAGAVPGAYLMWKLYELMSANKENERIRSKAQKLVQMAKNPDETEKVVTAAVKRCIADSFIDVLEEVYDDEEMEKDAGFFSPLARLGKLGVNAVLGGYGANVLGGLGSKIFGEGDAQFGTSRRYNILNPWSGYQRAIDFGVEKMVPGALRKLFRSKPSADPNEKDWLIPGGWWSKLKENWPYVAIPLGLGTGMAGLLSYLATEEYLRDPEEEAAETRTPKLV